MRSNSNSNTNLTDKIKLGSSAGFGTRKDAGNTTAHPFDGSKPKTPGSTSQSVPQTSLSPDSFEPQSDEEPKYDEETSDPRFSSHSLNGDEAALLAQYLGQNGQSLNYAMFATLISSTTKGSEVKKSPTRNVDPSPSTSGSSDDISDGPNEGADQSYDVDDDEDDEYDNYFGEFERIGDKSDESEGEDASEKNGNYDKEGNSDSDMLENETDAHLLEADLDSDEDQEMQVREVDLETERLYDDVSQQRIHITRPGTTTSSANGFEHGLSKVVSETQNPSQVGGYNQSQLNNPTKTTLDDRLYASLGYSSAPSHADAPSISSYRGEINVQSNSAPLSLSTSSNSEAVTNARSSSQSYTTIPPVQQIYKNMTPNGIFSETTLIQRGHNVMEQLLNEFAIRAHTAVAQVNANWASNDRELNRSNEALREAERREYMNRIEQLEETIRRRDFTVSKLKDRLARVTDAHVESSSIASRFSARARAFRAWRKRTEDEKREKLLTEKFIEPWREKRMMTSILTAWRSRARANAKAAQEAYWRKQIVDVSSQIVAHYNQALADARERLTATELQLQYSEQDKRVLEEKLRQSFLRGVSALNREAFALFRGSSSGNKNNGNNNDSNNPPGEIVLSQDESSSTASSLGPSGPVNAPTQMTGAFGNFENRTSETIVSQVTSSSSQTTAAAAISSNLNSHSWAGPHAESFLPLPHMRLPTQPTQFAQPPQMPQQPSQPAYSSIQSQFSDSSRTPFSQSNHNDNTEYQSYAYSANATAPPENASFQNFHQPKSIVSINPNNVPPPRQVGQTRLSSAASQQSKLRTPASTGTSLGVVSRPGSVSRPTTATASSARSSTKVVRMEF